jgi:hypothetical protein
MKLGTTLAALTAATIGAASFVALAQTSSAPPAPKPAAGALPQPNPNAVQKSFRTQTPDEQQASSQTSSARDPIPVGSSRGPSSPGGTR